MSKSPTNGILKSIKEAFPSSDINPAQVIILQQAFQPAALTSCTLVKDSARQKVLDLLHQAYAVAVVNIANDKDE